MLISHIKMIPPRYIQRVKILIVALLICFYCGCFCVDLAKDPGLLCNF